jgi:poly-beta-hydroxyalkanoate depolymerase
MARSAGSSRLVRCRLHEHEHERHIKAPRALRQPGQRRSHAKATKDFTTSIAVLDLTAEFYIETVRFVFQEYARRSGA